MDLPRATSALGQAVSGHIGVLVVDDQAAVREGLARLISCASIPLRWVATAATSSEALSAVKRLRPEVVVLDVDLAGEDGLALIAQFSPPVGVLVLSSHGDDSTRSRAAALGALRFVEKHEPAADLLRAIAEVGHLQLRGDKGPASRGTTSPLPVSASSAAPAAGQP